MRNRNQKSRNYNRAAATLNNNLFVENNGSFDDEAESSQNADAADENLRV